MSPTPLLLSIPSYEDLAARLAADLGAEVGAVERRRFADGETYQRLAVDVRDRDVVLVAGTPTEADILLAYDLACAVARYGARRLTWLLPYFGYQTMERMVRPGEVVTAKTRARLISAVPPTAQGNRVVLLDLHAAGIPHYFGDQTPAFHLYGKPLVQQAVRAFTTAAAAEDPPVLTAPDAGRAKWVQSLADDLGVDAAMVYKRRRGDGEVQVTGVDARVRGRVAIIYDDMVRTGGTLLQAARALRDGGAVRVYAVTTHLVLPEGYAERVLDAGLLDGLAGTDSHPRARQVAHPSLVVRSVAPLFAAWLRGEDPSLLTS